MTTRFCGNVHDKDIVKVTADQAWDSSEDWTAKNIVDLDTMSPFCSANKPNQLICFDFQSRRVKPTHYTLPSNKREPDVYHLKNWVVEGSRDGSSWIEIDRREKNSDLNSSFAIKTFAVSKIDTFQMIRLRQIGPNHGNDNCLYVTALEIFRSLC
jgi:hypothetical protein